MERPKFDNDFKCMIDGGEVDLDLTVLASLLAPISKDPKWTTLDWVLQTLGRLKDAKFKVDRLTPVELKGREKAMALEKRRQ